MINKRKIQEINAGSMADISFLLLIFFLVATTMNVDTGLQRILPPMPPDNIIEKPMDINERNVMVVLVSKNDEIMIKNEKKDITQVKDIAKRFIENTSGDPMLPEKEEVDIPQFGKYQVSKGVISLQNDRGTTYNMYIMVQNELTRAFSEIRDAVSRDKFGKSFKDLPKEQREAVQKAVPLKISEAEPKNVEGGK